MMASGSNLMAKLVEEPKGVHSYAIADLNGPHLQTQHMADGKISLTLNLNKM